MITTVRIVCLSVGFTIVYLILGMQGSYEYFFKGWFFAPARAFRKFLCGMFLGHEYKDNKCVHCLKRRKNGTSD